MPVFESDPRENDWLDHLARTLPDVSDPRLRDPIARIADKLLGQIVDRRLATTDDDPSTDEFKISAISEAEALVPQVAAELNLGNADVEQLRKYLVELYDSEPL